jgi:hypothetical protein
VRRPMPGPAESAPWGDPRPSEVAGFAQASAAGALPVVPRTPPRLLPGPSAERAFNLFLVKLVGAALGAVVAMRVAMTLDSTWADLAAIGLGFAVFWLMLRWLAEVGRRNFEELKRGYTTLVLQYGMFKSTRDLRWWITNWRVPWDYSGLWVLRGGGDVVSAPSPDREPPGFYPSPHRTGWLELWTGCAWAGQYQRA